MLADLEVGAVIADKGYDSDAVLELIGSQGALAVIPPTRSRKVRRRYHRPLYRERNHVERFFNRLKQMRGIATRYDRRPDNFLAAIKLAAARIWINA